jgi:hypothetical protein
MSASNKNPQDLLRALLDTELTPERDVPMKRFGAGVSFRIKAIDAKTFNRIREQATYPVKGGGSQVDSDKLAALIVEKGTVEPKWNDPALVEAFGPTPVDVVQKRLLAGEITKLSAEILDLSGFNDEDDAIEDVKN